MPRPFEKGDVRINRKGRPRKGSALTDILNFKLDQRNDAGTLRRELVAEKLLLLAESGDFPALKYVCDRIDGRPKESIELNGVESKLKEIFNERSM